MSSKPTFAIIGAGQAGCQATQSLRQAGFDGRLILIGDEPHPPYQRPPLSKKYLSGDVTRERIEVVPERFYAENDVDCRFGNGVVELDAPGRRLRLGDGMEIAFDKALLATGSRSRALPIPGANLPGVYGLRTIRDVERIRPHLEGGRRLIIIGGGYIGLEVAAVMRALSFEVRVIEAADRVMSRTTSPPVSAYFEALHRANGVSFHLGAMVKGIAKSDRGLVVETDDGIEPADWVLIGIGGAPNVELAEAAGLATDNGIAVNALCETSEPGIYAAGDCTSFPSARYGRRLRLESVQNAIDQAKAAALSMLDKGEPYDPVPWFWSDQYDVKYQIAGLCQGAEKWLVRGDPQDGAFSVGYLKDGRLIALDAINQPRDYMMARRLVPGAVISDEARFCDAGVALNEAAEAAG